MNILPGAGWPGIWMGDRPPMNDQRTDNAFPPAPAAAPSRIAWHLLRLARPAQWAKAAFVLVGPMYSLRDGLAPKASASSFFVGAFLAAAAFSMISSACYVVNDLADRERDRLHPRKRHRPLASGAVSPAAAKIFALALVVAACACVAMLPSGRSAVIDSRLLTGGIIALYAANVLLYSFHFKHIVIADVMCLSLGFVLRVLAGCAAVAVVPSTWLLSVTLFFAMFMSFGKRLGERRTLADEGTASAHRTVQEMYTDDLLRMAVVVTGVATLLTYSLYTQEQDALYTYGFNLLWITVLPVTYALLRAIVLIEHGEYDDPTDLAVNDRPFQFTVLVFGLVTGGLLAWRWMEQSSASAGTLP